jgi:hypothetical protein
LAIAGVFAGADAAQAQSKPATQASLTVAGSKVLGDPKGANEDDAEEAEAKKNPMAWAGIGLKAGMAGMGSAETTINGYSNPVESRLGMQLSLPINLGGDGLGFMIEPLMTTASISKATKDPTGTVTGAEDVSLLGLGAYIGPTFNFHVIDPLYIGFGFGLKGAYLMQDGFDLAADLYGRVPVTGTYYLTKTVGLIAEVGFGYGASVFVDKPQPMLDPITQTVKNVSDDPVFGQTFMWDASLGVRLP